MRKIGLFALVISVACATSAVLTVQNEPVQAQMDCRGACGWQDRTCHHNCPALGTPEGDACHNNCQAAYRDCTSRCD